MQTGIPQGSPISPILYLFYNADLLDICERPGSKTSGMGFVDNVNILAYSTSTEENCRTFENIHRKCIQWASKHEAIFVSQKYKLIHFAKNLKRFNMKASVHKIHKDINPKVDIRILGVQLNTKLR